MNKTTEHFSGSKDEIYQTKQEERGVYQKTKNIWMIMFWILVIILIIATSLYIFNYLQIDQKLKIANQEIQNLQREIELINNSTNEENLHYWDNYKFELEDITKQEDFIIDPKTHNLLNDPYDTTIWKIDKKTGEREIFISSTKSAVGNALMNIGLPGNDFHSGEILKLNDKIYLRPYTDGVDYLSLPLWQLNLATKKFNKLLISEFMIGFGATTLSPDGSKILNTQEKENDQILRILDIQKDDSQVIATTSGNTSFRISKGLGLSSYGGPDWIDDHTIKVRYYDNTKGDGCSFEKPCIVEEKIIYLGN
jgi:hypothetical protein